MDDIVLLWILEILLLLASVLQILLAKKRGQPLSPGWKIQSFAFAILLLAALVVFQTGNGDYIFPAVLLGLLEELVCWAIKRRRRKAEAQSGNAKQGKSNED